MGHDDDAGLSAEEIVFSVLDPRGGFISRSKDYGHDPSQPTFLLAAGHDLGTYVIEATNAIGDLVGSATFEVGGSWDDESAGPPLAIWSAGGPDDYAPGWSPPDDDPNGPCSPQWTRYSPKRGTRTVGVVFVDTSSSRLSSADVKQAAVEWEQHLFTGVPGEPGPPSMSKYYREVSSDKLKIEGKVVRDKHGDPIVVKLPKGWKQNFYWEKKSEHWYANGSFAASVVALSKESVNYRKYDFVIFVVKSGSESQFVWPTNYGWERVDYEGKGLLPEHTEIGVNVMPLDHEKRVGKRIYATAAHEIGHSLQLPDLYEPELWGSDYKGRSVGGWDLMAQSARIPQFALPHQIALGWIPSTKIKCIRHQPGALKQEVVSLHPSAWATYQPSPLNYSAVEIRLGERSNYLVELRKSQLPTQYVTDQNLPSDPAILITEVGILDTPRFVFAPERGDGPVLTSVGDTFGDGGGSTTSSPLGMRIYALDIQGGEILIETGTSKVPELSIREWDKSYHSPDLFVRNARNWNGSTWINAEWRYDVFGDNPNRVVASFLNEGNLDAPQVGVRFEYTRAGANEKWQPIGSIVYRDVAQLSSVEFVSDEWIPDPGELLPDAHYCVRARIVGSGDGFYSVPGTNPPIRELTKSNNSARSNFQRMISATSSPSSRVAQFLEIGNPTDREQIVYIKLRQTNPLYRSYLGASWFRMDAFESRDVLVMSEFAGTDDSGALLMDEFRFEPNRVIVEAYLGPGELDSIELIGGNQIEVVEGLAVQFQRFAAVASGNEVVVSGDLRVKSGGAVPPGGSIILTIDTEGKLENRTIPLSQGSFITTLPREGWDAVRAYFLPPPGYADVTSKTVLRP